MKSSEKRGSRISEVRKSEFAAFALEDVFRVPDSGLNVDEKPRNEKSRRFRGGPFRRWNF
jgi:hypothetical protein